VLGWPKRCKLAHAFLLEYSCKKVKLAQLLGQLGVFLTCAPSCAANGPASPASPRTSTVPSPFETTPLRMHLVVESPLA
jgi:hypothetical protein